MKRFLRCGFALAMAGLMTVSAQAGWILSGNSQFGPPTPAADGSVSFAVWEREGTSWLADFGFVEDVDVMSTAAFGNNIDADADFVYFYQVVNNNPSGEANDSFLSLLILPENAPGVYTSRGYLNEMVFVDGDGAVGSGNGGDNIALGDDRTAGNGAPADAPGDGVPSDLSDPVGSFFVDDPNAMNPTAGQLVTDLVTSEQVLQFTLAALLTNDYTTVMFATSNSIPRIDLAQIQDGTRSSGDIAVPTPVPAGLALLLSGLPGLGMVMLRRKKVVAAA